jgi:hypothetical protein
MQDGAKKVSLALFVLALVCFLLPFATFSCGGQKVMSMTGMQMAIGTSIQEPQMFGPPKTRRLNPEPLAMLALISVVAGIGLSFLKGKRGILGAAGAGGFGAILLLALKSKIESDVTRQSGGVIQTEWETGFYFTLLLFLGAVAVSAFLLMRGKGIPMPQLKSGAGYKYCTACGSRNEPADLFCKECGAKFGS